MRNYNLQRHLETLPTPYYYYDLDLLERTLEIACTEANSYGYKLHYAVKANSNPMLLSVIKERGLGADCVSGNEIQRALESGFDSNKIVFAGVGKTDDEIRIAIQNNIACFNCESLQEIQVINEIANELMQTVNIAIRINPNINAKTHAYITTGLQENKFGISYNELQQFIDMLDHLTNINLTGLHFHIGSQICDLDVFRHLAMSVSSFLTWFSDREINIEHINLGGGLGIDYDHPEENDIPPFKDYFQTIHDALKINEDIEVHFEPGRSIVGQCGSLVTKVIYVKDSGTKKFVIVDAGLTELIRPALYKSYHQVENISSETGSMKADIVGPVCETSDSFGANIILTDTKRGDHLILKSAGAYGEVMASNYNLRSTVKAYYSSDFFLKENENLMLENAS